MSDTRKTHWPDGAPIVWMPLPPKNEAAMLILHTLDRQAQEILELVLHEAGGDLRQALALWEAVKAHRASLPLGELANLPHDPNGQGKRDL